MASIETILNLGEVRAEFQRERRRHRNLPTTLRLAESAVQVYLFDIWTERESRETFVANAAPSRNAKARVPVAELDEDERDKMFDLAAVIANQCAEIFGEAAVMDEARFSHDCEKHPGETCPLPLLSKEEDDQGFISPPHMLHLLQKRYPRVFARVEENLEAANLGDGVTGNEIQLAFANAAVWAKRSYDRAFDDEFAQDSDRAQFLLEALDSRTSPDSLPSLDFLTSVTKWVDLGKLDEDNAVQCAAGVGFFHSLLSKAVWQEEGDEEDELDGFWTWPNIDQQEEFFPLLSIGLISLLIGVPVIHAVRFDPGYTTVVAADLARNPLPNSERIDIRSYIAAIRLAMSRIDMPEDESPVPMLIADLATAFQTANLIDFRQDENASQVEEVD